MQKFLSIEEAADLLRYKRSYLYKLAERGAVPSYRPRNGRVLFAESDLLAFMARARRSASYEIEEVATAALNAPGRRARAKAGAVKV